MNKKYFSLILSALWPGLGHLYLRKPAGVVYFLIPFLLLAKLLQGYLFSLILSVSIFFWAAILWDCFTVARKKKDEKIIFWPLIPCLLVILIFIYFSLPITWRSSTFAGNLHTHTTCSDGNGAYEDMINMALKLKLDFIAITDHRLRGLKPYTGPGIGNDTSCEEIFAKCPKEDRILCIMGQEVTGRVHIGAIGIKEPIAENLPIPDIVQEIHRQGGIAIANHPFESSAPFTKEELINSGFDAMECTKASRKKIAELEQISQEYNIPCVYNSDAHSTLMLRSIFNTCDQKIKTLADLKKALQENKCHKAEPLDAQLMKYISPYYWK